MGLMPLMNRLGLSDNTVTESTRGTKRKAGGKETSTTMVPPAFVAFREACRAAQPAWEKVRGRTSERAVAETAKDIVDILSGIGCPVPRSNGYVRKTVIRSLMLACPSILQNAEWGGVLRTDLQAWAPDQTGALEQFPPTTSAEHLSMFMFGRPDWGLLVSMWCCLWKQVLPIMAKAGVQPDEITPEIAGAICEVATAMQGETGRVNSPAVVVRQWLEQRST